MTDKLLLVDLENRQKLDLSLLDASFRVVIYVGHTQNPPKATLKSAKANRFTRLDFQKIEGGGKNALDFHIAFQLGRTFETAPQTKCYVLSGDGGFDPLIAHINKNGLWCQRINKLEDLSPVAAPAAASIELTVCNRCHKASTIDHHGGKWCTNCGCFASPANPVLLPSNQPGFRESKHYDDRDSVHLALCADCHQTTDMTGGIYDDGEWMCGNCIARYIE